MQPWVGIDSHYAGIVWLGQGGGVGPAGITSIGVKLAGFSDVPGYASLLATIMFLSGVRLIVIGMVGQRVAWNYDEVRAQPLRGLPT